MDEEVYILTTSQLRDIVVKGIFEGDDIIPPSMESITRLELVDHTSCDKCKGTGIIVAENYKLSGHTCNTCGGGGFIGRSVIFWNENKTVKASVQDDGRTLKLFISDREKNV